MSHQIKPQKIVFETVWGKDVSSIQKEVTLLWKQFIPDLDELNTGERMSQIVHIAKNEFDQVVAISTAFKAEIKQLKNYLYAVRLLVVPGYRIPGLESKLMVMTRDFLASIYKNDKTDPCIGIITLVENSNLRKFRNEAVWRASQMVYIGNSRRGSHIRVYYFKGALIN